MKTNISLVGRCTGYTQRIQRNQAFRCPLISVFFFRYDVLRCEKSSDCVTLLFVSIFRFSIADFAVRQLGAVKSFSILHYSRRVHRCANCAIRLYWSTTYVLKKRSSWCVQHHNMADPVSSLSAILHRPHTMARRNIFSRTVTVTVTKGADLRLLKTTRRWSSFRHGVIRRQMPY